MAEAAGSERRDISNARVANGDEGWVSCLSWRRGEEEVDLAVETVSHRSPA